MREVPKSVQQVISVAEILNADAQETGHGPTTSEDLAMMFPTLDFKTSESAAGTVSTHCEPTLALHSRNIFITSRVVEIGISKGSCWLCQCYMESIRMHTNIRILVSEYSGKMHSG